MLLNSGESESLVRRLLPSPSSSIAGISIHISIHALTNPSILSSLMGRAALHQLGGRYRARRNGDGGLPLATAASSPKIPEANFVHAHKDFVRPRVWGCSVHRGVVQSAPEAFGPRLRLACQLRGPVSERGMRRRAAAPHHFRLSTETGEEAKDHQLQISGTSVPSKCRQISGFSGSMDCDSPQGQEAGIVRS